MSRPTITATLLANGPYVHEPADYRLLEVCGPDAGEYLQRICTQDVQGLDDGVVAPVAFLDAKGKVRATALGMRFGDAFLLEVQGGQASELCELLERYHFTEQLTIQLRDPLLVRETIGPALGAGQCLAEQSHAGVTVQFARRGLQFTRWHGASGVMQGAVAEPTLVEALRMAAGMVRVGLETESSTLALEADLDDHCSATKGCYTGQEIVARIHTYGHVNRRLCLLRLEAGDVLNQPTTLLEPEDELPVGRVLHAVPIELDGTRVRLGLGYLPTDFQAAGTRLQLESGGAVEVVAADQAQ